MAYSVDGGGNRRRNDGDDAVGHIHKLIERKCSNLRLEDGLRAEQKTL
jgi:hypothetical protein